MSDYIKREDAVLGIAAFLRFTQPMARRIVDEIPSADVVEQKHGEWIRSVDELGEAWMCSECLEEFIPADGMDEFISYVHYCPNCGARMDGDS